MAKHARFHLLTVTSILLLLGSLSPLFAATRGLQIQTNSGPIDFYNDYHAIVIGVSDYALWPKLPHAIEDAIEVSQKLLLMGYNVKLVTDPDSAELNLILTRIAWEKGKEQNRALLVYFAGHGETVELADGSRLGYIIPRDCPLQSVDPYDFDNKAVSMKTLEMLAMKIKSRHVLMLFDSCFSGSIFGLSRAAPSEINQKSLLPVRQFITSGDKDEQVPDKSMFKICFLQALDGYGDYNKDGYLTGSELGMYLQDNVIQYTRGKQHPQYGKINNPMLDKGDFVFEVGMKTARNIPVKQDDNLIIEKKASTKRNQEVHAPQDDGPKYASLPTTVSRPATRLRSSPMKLSENAIRSTVNKLNFFDKALNSNGQFENRFIDMGNEIILDESTGLMWEKGRSNHVMAYFFTNGYIDKLNNAQLGGYSDWRMPTVEELASLLEAQQFSNAYIDPLFPDSNTSFWTADTADPKGFSDTYRAGWVVSFSTGQIVYSQGDRYKEPPNSTAISPTMNNNCVRAVRTVTE